MNIDVIDPAIYEVGVPYDSLRRLRAEAPVHFHPEPEGRGFWAVTRHRDVVAISRDPATFSSYLGGVLLADYVEGSDDLEAQRCMLVNMDPPQHVKFRNIVKHGFVPRMVAGLEGKVRQRVRRILDAACAHDEIDFLEEVAAKLPLEVIAEMIGVPEEDRPLLYDWSNRMVASTGPQSDAAIRSLREGGQAAAMQMWSYAGELAQRRYDDPRDDLISVLMRSVVDGEQLSPFQFAAFFMLLVVAGNETTRNVIAGGLLALAQHPRERARLAADPSLLPSAIEEMLRWFPPINQFRRTAARDVVLGGQTIREGDKLAMFYSSANRDEE